MSTAVSKKTNYFNYAFWGVIAVIGYSKYNAFIQFINDLKLSLKTVQITSEKATVFISSTNVLGIPYRITKMEFLVNKIMLASIIKKCDLNRSIVKNSHIPIELPLLYKGLVTKQKLEGAELVVTYSFFGLKFERLYKLQANPNLEGGAEPVSQTIDITKKKCSCQKH